MSALLRRLRDLDGRWLPVAALSLDRRLNSVRRRIDLTPEARRVLRALGLVLVACALGLILVRG